MLIKRLFASHSEDASPEEFIHNSSCLLEKLQLSLTDFCLAIYNRTPTLEEVDRFYNIFDGSIRRYFSEQEVFSLRFKAALPQLFAIEANANLVRFIHIPKTAGTSLIQNIESFSDIPTWSFDQQGFPLELVQKLPSLFDNARKTGYLYVRSHLSFSDQNHLFRFRVNDKTLVLIRDPVMLLISMSVHCLSRFSSYCARYESLECALENISRSESCLADHEKEYSHYARFIKSLAFTNDNILSILLSEKFREFFSCPLSRFLGRIPSAYDHAHFYIVDSSQVDHYLNSLHKIASPARLNTANYQHIDLDYLKHSLWQSSRYDLESEYKIYHALSQIKPKWRR